MAGTIHSTIGTDRTDMAGIMVGTTHTIGVGDVDIHITIITTIIHIVHRTTGLHTTTHHTTTHHTRVRAAWATRDTTTTTALVRS